MELLIENALIIGSNEFYRAVRYNVPLVVMLVNSDDRNAFSILEQNIRQTDIIQQLDTDTIVVFLSHTTMNEANKFIEKMQKLFQFTTTYKEFEDFEQKFLAELFRENEKKSPTI